ncbi:FtsK/SpoIIIE domain-containing protein [Glutamicibacter ardleyensis]|uniref:FtsK/SpoIIIE domain-containing protein n=1 Tax=Glutamicibacter ardleyensis TaxID=225894 RepID=UPI003FD3DF08
MARRRTATDRKPKAVPMTVLGFILMFAMSWLGLPGIPFLWAALLIGAFAYPPFVYTGKKNKSGRPTALDDQERDQMRKYHFWADMRSSIAFKDAFAPGKNILLSWMGSLIISIAIFWVPVSFPSPGSAVMNSIFALATLAGIHGSRRRTMVEDELNPGVRADAVIKLFKGEGRNKALGLGIGGLIGGMVIAAIINIFRPVYETVFTAPTWSLYLIFGFGLPLLLLGLRVRDEAIKQWKNIVEAREEWRPRWQMLNIDPAPKLIDRVRAGQATVDTFLADGSMGAQKFWPMSSQIAQTIGGGMVVHTLDVHDEKKDGSPIPGSRSPLKFDVSCWSHEDDQDAASSATPFAFVELKARCALAKACDEGKLSPRFVFESVHPITVAPVSKVQSSVASVEGQIVPYSDTDLSEAAKNAEEEDSDEALPMIYQLKWSHIDGADARSFLELATGEFATAIGTQALTDHRAEDGNGCLYFGQVDADVEFTADSPVNGDDLDELLGEMQWAERWRSANAKLGANPPRPEWGLHETSELANGAVLESLAFVTREGVTPTEMFGVEKELPTVLDAAPFVSMVGFDPNSTGRRHPQAIVVRHSNAHTIPASPQQLAPSPGEKAPTWVLAGLLNRAFKSARLARPELVQASCLTSQRATKHIWKMDVYLHDGVTLTEVRSSAMKLRSALGCSWLRVAEHPDGCTIIAGGTPNHDILVNPDRDETYLEQLNWDQMFLDSGLYGTEGRLPRLTAISSLPKNPKVKIFEFDVSDTGIEFPAVKEKVEKLKTVTKNAWVDPVRDGNDATKLIIRTSQVNPMPELSRYDFNYVDQSKHLPFATGVDGEPIELNLEDSPHLLIAGTTGGGKSVLLQALIYSVLVRNYELTIIDPVKGGADFTFAKPYSQAFTGDLEEARAIIRTLYDEVKSRKNLNTKFGVGGYRELPLEIRPKHSVILIDEFTSLMTKEPVPGETDDPDLMAERERVIQENQWRMEIGTFVGKIGREARSAGFTLVLATQKLTAKLMDQIPGGNDLKTNMARGIAGNASIPERMSALRIPSESPKLGDVIPKGRGIYEPLTSNGMMMQVWFEPGSQSTLSHELQKRVSPVPEEFKLDLGRYLAQREPPVSTELTDVEEEPVFELIDAGDIFSGFNWDEVDEGEPEQGREDGSQTVIDMDSKEFTADDLTDETDARSSNESSNSPVEEGPAGSSDAHDELLAFLEELENEPTISGPPVVVSEPEAAAETQSSPAAGIPYVPASNDMVIPELLQQPEAREPVLQSATPSRNLQEGPASTEFDRLNLNKTFLVLGVEGVLLPSRPKGKTKSFSTPTRGRTRYRSRVVEMLAQHPQHMVLCNDEDDAQELREAIGHNINFVPAGEYMRAAAVYLLKSRRRLKAHTILVADQRLFEPSIVDGQRWIDVIGSYLHRPGRIHARYIEVEPNSGISAEHLLTCIEWLGDRAAAEPDGVADFVLSDPDPWLSEQVTGAKRSVIAPEPPVAPSGHSSPIEPRREPVESPEVAQVEESREEHPKPPEMHPVSAQGGFTLPGEDW